MTPPRTGARMITLGIVGGIGAGKSEVARAFARAGCVVSDSDKHAKAVLDDPEIQAVLRSWWGSAVAGVDGRVDRQAIAKRVFNDPAARARLEGLVHPRIHELRAQERLIAERSGAKAFIIDAPLLFEAGVDRECDAVVFVEAPVEARRERVRATRGWDDAELGRREAAQMSLDEKRRRCRYVINNGGKVDDIDAQVALVLADVSGERGFG